MKFLYKLEKTCAFLGKRFYRVANFIYYLRGGITLGYPLCCTLHFSWDVSNPKLKNKSLTHGPAVKRGSIFAGVRENGEEKLYVPCAYHKGRHSGWEPYRRRPKQLQLFETLN